MANGVFATRVVPDYDDIPELRYHFPQTYLNAVRQTVGDWILYYEPRRGGGRLAYFATARVRSVEPDRGRADHYYAYVDGYAEFPEPVPFREGDRFWESALRKSDGTTSKGAFGRAVRLLPSHEYRDIVRRGYLAVMPAQAEWAWDVAEPEADYGRPVVERLVARPVREAAFQELVRRAYDATCALTGLRLVNGGGRCEIEAAHIRPVADAGPDSPRNGIALSRTCHWMFDRGILSLDDDGRILQARGLVPEAMQRMLYPHGYAQLPDNRLWRPHVQFLRFHREHVFRG